MNKLTASLNRLFAPISTDLPTGVRRLALVTPAALVCLGLSTAGFQARPEAWQVVMATRGIAVAYDTSGLHSAPWYPDLPTELARRPFRLLIVTGPDGPDTPYHHVVSEFTVDCAARQQTALREIMFDRSGQPVSDDRSLRDSIAVDPATVAGAVADMVCGARHNIALPPTRYTSVAAVIIAYEQGLAGNAR